jgi:N-acetylneuraminate lyase
MKTKGLIAAPPTGFRADGNVDLKVVAPLAEHLQRQGVVGVFVNGTTGEGMSLSTEEREQLAVEWRRVLPAGMKLFVHVGHNSLPDCQRLSRHAQEIGADAIAAIAPGFFKSAGVAGLVEWCVPVAAAAPELPFYFYHMPSMTGVHVSTAEFLALAGKRIPNLAGIKFTFEAMGDYLAARLVDGGRFDVLWGRDEMLLGALAMGAEGGVGSTYNAITPIFLKLIEAFRRGDMAGAQDLQAKAGAIINVLAGSGNFFSALKALLQIQGVPITPATRSPLDSLTPEQAAALYQKLQAIL